MSEQVANHFMAPDHERLSEFGHDAIVGLDQCPAVELPDTGVFAITTAIAALQQYGAPRNIVRHLFNHAMIVDLESSLPSAAASKSNPADSAHERFTPPVHGTTASALTYDFCNSVFCSLIRRGSDPSETRFLLKSIHVVLVWLHGIDILRAKMRNDYDSCTTSSLMGLTKFPWDALCSVLNIICQYESMGPRIVEHARNGMFPKPPNSDTTPLFKDYVLRGLNCTRWYHPPGFFGDQSSEGDAFIEASSPALDQSRVDRIIGLAIYLASRDDYINFNPETRTFSSNRTQSQMSISTKGASAIDGTPDGATDVLSRPCSSRTTKSSDSDSDGYVLVQAPKLITAAKAVSTVSKIE